MAIKATFLGALPANVGHVLAMTECEEKLIIVTDRGLFALSGPELDALEAQEPAEPGEPE